MALEGIGRRVRFPPTTRLSREHLPKRLPLGHLSGVTAEPLPALAPPVVLIVDDFEDARAVLGFYLKLSGYVALEAATGEDALPLALDSQPDIILMDLQLPGMDGWEVSRRLKADARTRHIPIIALTAHAMQSERERALVSGCDGFLSKPCSPPDVGAEIARLLALRESRPMGDSR
jgi:two-component system, cell cycle response regulator DivK